MVILVNTIDLDDQETYDKHQLLFKMKFGWWVATYTLCESTFLLILFQYSGKITQATDVHVAGNRRFAIKRASNADGLTSGGSFMQVDTVQSRLTIAPSKTVDARMTE